jgi:hypothetical protein
MLRFMILASSFLAGGCGFLDQWQHPEVAACEHFIKESLASPSSYKRIEFLTADEAISVEDYASGEGWEPNSAFYDLAKERAVDPAIRSVSIEYDAQNGFGALIRQYEHCEFLMSDSASNEFGIEPRKAAETTARTNLTFAIAPGLEDGQRIQRPCCLHVYLQARRKAAE